jgi:hypothetical protein
MNALRTSIGLVIGAAAAVSTFGAGCTAGGGGPGPEPQPYPDTAERSYSGGGSEYGYSDRYDDPTPRRGAVQYADDKRAGDDRNGQQQFKLGGKDDDNNNNDANGKPLVPRTARQVAEGRGDLSYKATRDGFVYVIDFHDKKLEFEGPINKDETVTIAPYRNQIEIDGKRVKRVPDLNNKHVHRIFFEREGDHRRDRRDR